MKSQALLFALAYFFALSIRALPARQTGYRPTFGERLSQLDLDAWKKASMLKDLDMTTALQQIERSYNFGMDDWQTHDHQARVMEKAIKIVKELPKFASRFKGSSPVFDLALRNAEWGGKRVFL